MTFADHVILITGASTGIGKALSLALAAERPKLVLAARNRERLDQVARECTARGAETLVVPSDVTVESQCRELVSRAVERVGRLDVLVNNAGRAMWSRFDELTELSVVEEVMRLNYLGGVYCTYYALPHLRESRGRLVAMASVSGLTGVPMLSGYSASKHAVIGFFESLRIELAPFGVSVTILAPDFVQSEILERALGPDGEPLNRSPLDPKTLLNPADTCKRIVKAMARRERLVVISKRSKHVRLAKLLVPWAVDWLTERAVRGE